MLSNYFVSIVLCCTLFLIFLIISFNVHNRSCNTKTLKMYLIDTFLVFIFSSFSLIFLYYSFSSFFPFLPIQRTFLSIISFDLLLIYRPYYFVISNLHFWFPHSKSQGMSQNSFNVIEEASQLFQTHIFLQNTIYFSHNSSSIYPTPILS